MWVGVAKIENLLLFLMQGIPEMSGIVALSLALAKVPLRWGRIITAGTVLAFILFFIRISSLTVGLHTVAALLLMVILITLTTRVPPSKAFVVVLISLILLGFLELIIFKSLFALVKPEQQLTMSNYSLLKLLSLPQAVIIIFTALLIPRYMTPEQDAWKI